MKAERISVLRGGAGALAILRAFLRARGPFKVETEVGFMARDRATMLVLVTVDGTRAAFSCDEARTLGEDLIDAIPGAIARGAPNHDVELVRRLAGMLLLGASEAAALAPERLH